MISFDFCFPKRDEKKKDFLEHLNSIVEDAAKEHSLQPNLIRAIIYQESFKACGNWEDALICMRYEPRFYERYIMNAALTGYIPKDFPPNSATERKLRAFSFGLMQIMGTTAREFNFKEPFLTSLLDVDKNVFLGAKILAKKIRIYGRDKGIRAYNGDPESDATAAYLQHIESHLFNKSYSKAFGG